MATPRAGIDVIIKPDINEACPCGILNVAAALETYALLETGTEDLHRRLREWIAENYLEGNLGLLNLNEPLGRRIRSTDDLGMLASAYGRARALRRPSTTKMKNELYFYGQKPGWEEGRAAGEFIKQYFKPEQGSARVVARSLIGQAPKRSIMSKPNGLLHRVKSMCKGKGKEPLDTVGEVPEEE